MLNRYTILYHSFLTRFSLVKPAYFYILSDTLDYRLGTDSVFREQSRLSSKSKKNVILCKLAAHFEKKRKKITFGKFLTFVWQSVV